MPPEQLMEILRNFWKWNQESYSSWNAGRSKILPLKMNMILKSQETTSVLDKERERARETQDRDKNATNDRVVAKICLVMSDPL